MSDEETIPTWGYKGDEPKLFHLKEGEGLPSGYADSPGAPAKKAAPKKKAKPEPEPEIEDVADDDGA